MWIRIVDSILAAAGLAGHLIVLALLVQRRWLTRFPVFAFLMGFYLLRSVLLLTGQLSPDSPRSYWLWIYLDPSLQLLLMLSLALRAWRSARARVAIAAPSALLIALAGAWYLGPSRDTAQNVALKLSLFVSALWLIAAFFLPFVLSNIRGAGGKIRLGITLGFAAYSAANIATEIVHMHFAPNPRPDVFAGLSFFRALVYLASLAGWSVLIYKDNLRLTTL